MSRIENSGNRTRTRSLCNLLFQILLLQHQVADMVKHIATLGHEVAYHYDVLDACNGDFNAAFKEFDRYKTILEVACGQQITTVCPHGNPTKVRDGRSNKDFFRSDLVRPALSRYFRYRGRF